jgi:16S rRNA processing protein RimM
LYQNAEILIPVTDQIVLNLDTEKKELYTNLPDGLIEVYLSGDEEID